MKFNKTAIIYDWMDSWGGVERMLLILNEMYPEADWYTSYVDSEKASWVETIRKDKVKASFIQKLPAFIRQNRILSLPFYPYAFESFDLSDYDLAISVTSSFAKGVITRPDSLHLCILLTPTRWLWGQEHSYRKGIPAFAGMTKLLKEPVTKKLKQWDYVAAKRPDKIISISQTVADRCKEYYDRDSQVIYPPFDREYWDNVTSSEPSVTCLLLKDYFLVISRLEPYKKVDLVIESFNQMKEKHLVIVGSGSQKKRLRQMAGKNIQFLEHLSDEELAYLYSHAQALIMPQEEDFGYVALESQFFGCPVIAFTKGGASETVIDGKTGILFPEQSRDCLRDTVERFEGGKYNLEDKHGILDRFSREQFVSGIQNTILRYTLPD